MVCYKCDKCNKEFNQKSNYMAHINRKKSCNTNDNTNIILYKCEICDKIKRCSQIAIQSIIFKIS